MKNTLGYFVNDKYLYYQSEVIKKRKEQGIHPDKINYLDDDKIDKTIEPDIFRN